MALTKAEMSEYLFEKLGLSKRDAKELVELFEEVRRALENGEQVKLSGFGNFDLRDKTSVRAVTRRRGRYSNHRPPRGDIPSGAEVEKSRGERVTQGC